jgi:hypothetical protein
VSEGWRGWSARRSDDAAHCHFLIEQMREALRNSVLSVTLTDESPADAAERGGA